MSKSKENINNRVLSNEDKPIMQRSLDVIFHALLPKDDTFFPLFEQSVDNLLEAAKQFEISINSDASGRMQSLEKLAFLEKQADEITQAIITTAINTFLVPFDREDIQELANAIDDVLDLMYGTAKRIELYKVTTIPDSMKEIATKTRICVEHLHGCIHAMRKMRYTTKIQHHLIHIHQMENEVDQIMNNELARIFSGDMNPIEVIKIQEVLTMLEDATDKCEDAANVIESVFVKMS
jgi:uncharacterized protein